MTTSRRTFVKNATLGAATGVLTAAASAASPALAASPGGAGAVDPSKYIIVPGPKATLRGLKAACSTENPAVNEAILKVLRAGGNAVDAAIAGCMVQAVVEPHLTNHTGTVSFLYYEAKTKKFYQLDSTGTFPSGLRPFRPGHQGGEDGGYSAIIPNFMPGMKAMFERFGTRPWASLCEDAIRWSEDGHFVTSQEYASLSKAEPYITYFPEGRQFYMPDGFLPPVGHRFVRKDTAATLRKVAAQGPDYMITGPWADNFIATANRMGWAITKKHMTETPPRWIEPMRFKHNEYEIVGLAAPQQQGVFVQMVLGILRHLDIRRMKPGSADHLFYMSHAMRWALYHCGYTGDPVIAPFAVASLADDNLHATVAQLLRGLRPKVDLSEHVRLTRSPHGDAGIATGRDGSKGPTPSTCEVSIVDQAGNWVQMTHTYQAGGIPGMVVDGIPMRGSSASFTGFGVGSDAKIVAGSRMRRALGSTFVLKDGAPVYALGSPGNVLFTVPQILTNLLDFQMEPYAALDAPRMHPLQEYGSVTVEDRIGGAEIERLAALGLGVEAIPQYDYDMGSYQMCFIDQKTGQLGATADPRRSGTADGLR
jgi:gamma-glutamyltranspeptidase/glutathione hydrolase